MDIFTLLFGSSVLGAVTNATSIYNVFGDKISKKLRRAKIKPVFLTTERINTISRDQQLILGDVRYGRHPSLKDWEMALKIIKEYYDEIGSSDPFQSLLISDNQVNLAALFAFGWFFDCRSKHDIRYVKPESGGNGKMLQYLIRYSPTDTQSPFFDRPADPHPDVKYNAIACYVGCKDKAREEEAQPFDKYVDNMEKEKEGSNIYRLKFVKQLNLIPETKKNLGTDLAFIAKEVYTAINRICDQRHFDCSAPPIYLFLNVAAPIAIALGMQLGIFKVNICTFNNDTRTYQEAFTLSTESLK